MELSAAAILVFVLAGVFVTGLSILLVARSSLAYIQRWQLQAAPFEQMRQRSVSGFLILALGGVAAMCQVVLFVMGRLFENAAIPESQYVSVFFFLLPTMLISAMGSVLIALRHWQTGITGRVYAGLTMSMVVLLSNVIWFASPALFPPR